MPVQNDDITAMRVIRRKNARQEVSAIRSQRRLSRDPERGR